MWIKGRDSAGETDPKCVCENRVWRTGMDQQGDHKGKACKRDGPASRSTTGTVRWQHRHAKRGHLLFPQWELRDLDRTADKASGGRLRPFPGRA